MNITIPIYIEKAHLPHASGPVYRLRPLFFISPQTSDENLNRATNRLVRDLRETLNALGKDERHEELASYTFCPDIEDRLLKLTLDMGERRASCKFLLILLRALDRKLAFTPSLPQVWFEVHRGETLHDRASEVFAEHFRELHKKDAQHAPRPEDVSIQGDAWVSAIEFDIYPPIIPPRPVSSLFALLGGGQAISGAVELARVGRCLDWLYPDELDRVVCRDLEVKELQRALKFSDNRPVLIVGPRLSGKTALIHEYVYRKVEKKRQPYRSKKNVWLLSPQRLISGMSYVGQWENRLLAILDEAKLRKHILYFDDLLGLFHAGVTRDSSLSVAHVLKPLVERRQFRLLGEITPEALSVFQERDRGFADLFHIVPIRESSEDETLQILIHLMRQMEQRHRCRFEIDAIPTCIDITRRYARDAAFPGKAVVFLKRLAVKMSGQTVTRATVLEEFRAKSGLSISFLDNRAKLERKEIVQSLRREVIGQDAAVETASDAIQVARARLNDTTRPLACFLFLGPTGVGKTQCAKTIASFLFGETERLLRFDMNEFISSASVARLTGTFDQPEGLLTSAVRRQPFSIVLLDEIEKAHPDAFNLLLQVMGDGRLTDALGRTVDFTNAIVIMTSNLGVREASSDLGFKRSRSREGSVYVQAARKFFKPEFFNRLDRIVPFESLSRQDVGRIARLLIQGVFAREGLARRKCILQIDDRAMESIIDEGYHPQLGARALKRSIERRLTQPVAARLAAMTPETPTIVSLYSGGDGFVVSVDPLVEAEPVRRDLSLSDGASVIDCVEASIERVEEEAAAMRPEGAIDTEQVSAEQMRYFLIREQASRMWKMCRYGRERLNAKRQTRVVASAPTSRARRNLVWAAKKELSGRQLWKEILATEDAQSFLGELAREAKPYGSTIENFLDDLLREAAMLELLASGEVCSRAAIVIRSLDGLKRAETTRLARLHEQVFRNQFGLEAKVESVGESTAAVVIYGLNAARIASIEEGTHLFTSAGESLVPIQAAAMRLGEEEEVVETVESLAGKRRSWLDRVASGEAGVEEDPFRVLPVIRVYNEQGVNIDLRSGLMSKGLPLAVDVRAFMLATLPLPQELESAD